MDANEIEALKNMQDFVDLLDEVIKDLTEAKNALADNLSFVSNPFKYLMVDGGEAEKIIKDNGNKANLYVLMANNKVAALNELFGKKGEEKDG